MNNMWGLSLPIEKDKNYKKEIAFSEDVVLAVNWATPELPTTNL